MFSETLNLFFQPEFPEIREGSSKLDWSQNVTGKVNRPTKYYHSVLFFLDFRLKEQRQGFQKLFTGDISHRDCEIVNYEHNLRRNDQL